MVTFLLFYSETGSHYVAGLELEIILILYNYNGMTGMKLHSPQTESSISQVEPPAGTVLTITSSDNSE